MIIQNIDIFKSWLTKTLQPLCDADPETLAKYIVALVKKEKSEEELRGLCHDQLEVFLQQKTKDFVQTLFVALQDHSYMGDVSVTTSNNSCTVTPLLSLPEIAPPLPPPIIIKPAELIPVKEESAGNNGLDNQDRPPALTQQGESNSETNRNNSSDRFDLRRKLEDSKVDDHTHRRSRSRSPPHRDYRDRDDRRRRFPDRRPFDDRGSSSRRYGRYESDYRRSRRSPHSPRRWSPPLRSRSPRSRSPPRARNWRRSRSGSRGRIPRTRSLSRSRSPRPRSPRARSRSPRPRSRSPRIPRPRSPRLRSRSPRPRSRSPRPRSRSPRPRSRARSVASNVSSRSWSPQRKQVRQKSPSDSRGSTPTLDDRDYSRRPWGGDTIRRMRCQDFDEKGYCMRGDMCPFDHGVDPVVVDDVNIGNVLPFPEGGPPPSGQMGQLPPGAPPHPNNRPPIDGLPPPGPPPGAPPGPPPSAVEGYKPEPYMPEAPAISNHSTAGPPPGYWNAPPGLLVPPHYPPPPPGIPPPHVLAQIPPPGTRQRDLITVQTLPDMDRSSASPQKEIHTSGQTNRVVIPLKRPQPMPTRTPVPPDVIPVEPSVPSETAPTQALPQIVTSVIPPLSEQIPKRHTYVHQPQSHTFYGSPRHKRPYHPGGARKILNSENSTLEVRKVPQEFNTIAKLNEHFCKFGTITNLQVSYEGDREGALVAFSSNKEAAAAYRSSEPIFNNRFIKIFWHNKEQQLPQQGNQDEKTEANQPTSDERRPSLKERLGIPPPHKLQLNNTTRNNEDKHAVVMSPTGNVLTTVFNPTAMKTKGPVSSRLGPPVSINPVPVRKLSAADHRRETLKKKMEIQKQKQLLLQKQLQQQKLLLMKLDRNKSLSSEDKGTIVKTIKVLAGSIEKLKKELLTSTGQAMQKPPPQKKPVFPQLSPPAFASKQQAEKAILDTELDIIAKSNKGSDTSELRQKVAELKKEAASLGLLGGIGRGRGRGAMSLGRGRGMGRGRGGANFNATSHVVDRRPRQLLVMGFSIEDKENLFLHLRNFGEVEQFVPDDNVPNVIVTYKTRQEAEQAAREGQKFNESQLSMAWYKSSTPTTPSEQIDMLNLKQMSNASSTDQDLEVTSTEEAPLVVPAVISAGGGDEEICREDLTSITEVNTMLPVPDDDEEDADDTLEVGDERDLEEVDENVLLGLDEEEDDDEDRTWRR